jgi:DNA-binding transcriptional MerR regulator
MEETSMLSVKQFAQMTGISESALRYYDKIGLFSPAARGRNNYRYYIPYQMIVLNFIKVLTELGVPLTRIKALAKDRTPRDVLLLLMEQERILDSKLQKIYASYSVIHTFEQNIQAGMLADETQITVARREETRITLGPECKWDDAAHFYAAFVDFCAAMDETGGNLNYPAGGCYDSIEAFKNSPSTPSRFFLLEPNGRAKIPMGNYLRAYVKSYYGEMGDTADRLMAYAKDNGLKFAGPVYVMYLLDEISVVDKSGYLARVSVRVMKR